MLMPSQYENASHAHVLIIEPNIRDYFSIIVLTYKKTNNPPPQKQNKKLLY